MNEVRWGIIGCGDVTEKKSGPAFQKAIGSGLVAVMRRNGKLARDYANRHNVDKYYDNADDLINDSNVNAVYIATPPSSHKKYVLAAAKSGKPIYVEKPMGLNYNECRDMIECCSKHNVKLFVAYYRRALPRFLKIKELLEDKVLGKVRFINITFHKKVSPIDQKGEKHWRVDPLIAGGGYFCDLASHMIDILQFFFGEIGVVKGFSSNQDNIYKAEDCVSGVFIFNNGIHGSGTWNFNSFTNLDRTEIIGNKGKITYATFGNSPIIIETEKGIRKINITNPVHIQQPLIQTIVDELLDVGKCPSTGISGASTNWVMDQMLQRWDKKL